MAKSAADYPVTFGWQAVDYIYYAPTRAQSKDPSKWLRPGHNGQDRSMPVNTPVYVNGVLIGFSGRTGAASGPHIHVSKYVGNNSVNPNGGGFSLPPPVKVHSLGHNHPSNGNFIRLVDGAGTVWFYGHLNSIKVAQGQVLTPAQTKQAKGAEEMINTVQDAELAYKVLRPNGGASPAELQATAGKRSWRQFFNDGGREIEARNAALRSQVDHMNAMQATINQQNQTLHNIQIKLDEQAEALAAKDRTIEEMKVAYESAAMELNELKDKYSKPPVVIAEPQTEAAKPTKKTNSQVPVFYKLLLALLKKRKA